MNSVIFQWEDGYRSKTKIGIISKVTIFVNNVILYIVQFLVEGTAW